MQKFGKQKLDSVHPVHI